MTLFMIEPTPEGIKPQGLEDSFCRPEPLCRIWDFAFLILNPGSKRLDQMASTLELKPSDLEPRAPLWGSIETKLAVLLVVGNPVE